MARESRRLRGELLAIQANLVRCAVWSEEMPELSKLNPYNEDFPESAEAQRLKDWQTKRAFEAAIRAAKNRSS